MDQTEDFHSILKDIISFLHELGKFIESIHKILKDWTDPAKKCSEKQIKSRYQKVMKHFMEKKISNDKLSTMCEIFIFLIDNNEQIKKIITETLVKGMGENSTQMFDTISEMKETLEFVKQQNEDSPHSMVLERAHSLVL